LYFPEVIIQAKYDNSISCSLTFLIILAEKSENGMFGALINK